MDFTLRPYQEYFYEEFFKAIASGKRHVCIAAFTGTGKTYMSAAIAKKFLDEGGVIIFIAPRINLVYQTIKSFESLGRVQVIQGQTKYDEDGKIYVASIQTLVKRKLSFEPALIIHDERHSGHTGKTTKAIMDKFPNAKYLSLTATPFDAKGHKLKGFDEILNYKTVQWFIDNNYLVDCECYAPVMPDLSKVKTTGGDYNEKELDSIMNNDVMIGNIIEETQDHIVGKKVLFFAVTIAHAEEVAIQYSIAGFRAKAYHSKVGDKDREDMIKDFEDGKIDILVSVSALVMGFDVPSVNCMIVARPTKSQSFYRQMIGRGMRPFPEKLICLLIDCAGVIKENGFPNQKVIPKLKKKKEVQTMTCKKCGLKSYPISKSLRKVTGVLNYVTTWSCKNSHTFETLKEAGGTLCPNCSLMIVPGGAKFKEDEKEYVVFAECPCGTEIIIRTIPKVKGKLQKIEANRMSKLKILEKIRVITKPDQKEKIQTFCKYIVEVLNPVMHVQALSSLYVSIEMGLSIAEIEKELMQTIVDVALEKNEYKCLSPKLIRMAYSQAKDPANIIHIHNSRAINPMNPAWATKTINLLRELESDFPQSKRKFLKAVITRCQNIHQKQQKMASMFYFFEFLRTQEMEGSNGYDKTIK